MQDERELDRRRNEDFRIVISAYHELRRHGVPAAYWELFWLLVVDRPLLENEVRYFVRQARQGRPALPTLALRRKIAAVRTRYGRLADALRRILIRLPGSRPPGEAGEMVLGVGMISRGLESWLNRMSEERAAEAGPRVARWTRLVRGALQDLGLLERRAKEELPKGVDRDVLADLRRLEDFRRRLDAASPPLERWPLLCLIADHPQRARAALDAVASAPRIEDVPPEQLRDLFAEIREVNAKYGSLATPLRAYVSGLPIGSFGPDTLDLAFSFVLASPWGRKSADCWLSDPERHRLQAAHRMEGLISRAQNYQTALRDAAA
jgi:hypothetical protein